MDIQSTVLLICERTDTSYSITCSLASEADTEGAENVVVVGAGNVVVAGTAGTAGALEIDTFPIAVLRDLILSLIRAALSYC